MSPERKAEIALMYTRARFKQRAKQVPQGAWRELVGQTADLLGISHQEADEFILLIAQDVERGL